MNAIELRIPPLGLFIVFAVTIWTVGAYFPAADIAFPGRRAITVSSFLLGWGVVSAGVFEFRRRKTTMSPLSPEKTASVVSSGIYRWSRNPMYLGMALHCLALPPGVHFGLALWRCRSFVHI